MVALAVYLTSTNDTVLTTARTLDTTAPSVGTTISSTNITKNSTGWYELYSQGGGSGTTPSATEVSASGHGFAFDIGGTTLDGQTIAAGTWTASIQLGAGYAATVIPVMRIFKYTPSLPAYTQFTNGGAAQDLTATSVTLTTTQTAATFSQALDSMDFAAGDKLYIDVLVDITAGFNTNSSGSRHFALSENDGAADEAVTPGYAPTSVSFTGSGGITAQAATLAGAGGEAFTGSGGLTTGNATLAGSGTAGTAGISGSGSLTAQHATLSGAGGEVFTGAGSLTAGAPQLTGAGVAGGTAGSGHLTVPGALLTGTGGQAFTGTGALAAQHAALAGAGLVPLTGTGALAARSPVLAGAGAQAFTAAGTFTAASPRLSGTGLIPVTVSYGTARQGQMAMARTAAGLAMVPQVRQGQMAAAHTEGGQW